jgi:mycoredoxin
MQIPGSDQQNTIQFYGTQCCGDCRRSERWLRSHKIPFQFIDVDKDPDAREYVKKVNQGNVSVPTIVLLDGSVLVEPTDDQLCTKLGG